MSSKFRNELKRWAQDIILEIKNRDEMEYKQYINFILSLFSTILLYRSENKKLIIKEKKDLYNDWLYNRLVEQFNRIDIKVDLNNINKIFINNLIDQIYNLIDVGYDDIDNMLAWLYQYLNINRNDNDIKDTQFFTDQYMVNYLVNNALNELESCYDYYSLDPACGGGNFIIVLIDKIYKTRKWSDELFVDYIEKYVYGYDIDQTLALICIINVNLKLIELGVMPLEQVCKRKFNIYSDTNNNVGSLLKYNDAINHKIVNMSDFTELDFNIIFNKKYKLILTNPPFKGRRLQDKFIRDYINENYDRAQGDICIAFIERIYDLLEAGGIAAYVSQNTWMYLHSFKELRKRLLTDGSIVSLVDLGPNSFIDLSGEKANIALMVYCNSIQSNKINVYNMSNLTYKQKNLLLTSEKLSEVLKVVNVSDILKDNDYRIDYRSEGKIRRAFEMYKTYGEYAKPMQGTSTGDNSKFVKYHWEVTGTDWIFVSKGGGYCKWSGLNLYKVKWGKDGEEVKKHPKSVVRNTKFFDSTNLVYSDTGTSGLSVRLLKPNQIFIASGPGIYITGGDKYCHLAFLNSRIASFYIKVLTPKLTISAMYIAKLPVVKEILYDDEISNLSKKTVVLKEKFNQKRPIDFEFHAEKYLINESIYKYVVEDFCDDLRIELERLRVETMINNKIIEYFNFDSSDVQTINDLVGENPYEIDLCTDYDLELLDTMISKMLDFNCCVKSSRINKQSLGIEGILEMLAVNQGYNPQKICEFIINNTCCMKKTLLKYYKYTLHRIKLCEINYLNSKQYAIDIENLRKIINNDISIYKLKIDDINWLNKELYNWHYNAFLKKPIITQGE